METTHVGNFSTKLKEVEVVEKKKTTLSCSDACLSVLNHFESMLEDFLLMLKVFLN